MKTKIPSIGSIAFLFALMLLSFESKSQSMMHVEKVSAEDTSFTVSKISKITFETGIINIAGTEDETFSYTHEEVSHILFDLPASSSSKIDNISTSRVFPNPAEDLININADIKEGTLISVYNSNGSLVAQQISNVGKNTLNISLLPVGLYIAEFTNNSVTERVKFLKK